MPGPVRVRFAPSPTGEPHVGNTRTALFNWLFARHHGGAFVLRIEDTDQTRLVPGSVLSTLDSLRWLGLDWDEGPASETDEGAGPYGPYLQSRRLSLYHRHAEELLARDALYPCFCLPERLDEMRRDQQRLKLPPGYDRHCLRTLSDEQRRARRDSGEAHVLRFRVPDEPETTRVDDLIRGTVTWENRLLDDFVALKSDGFPTYHLANVVDDHHMEITHVLRAEEWLSSTPRHLLLYDALGWTPPEFAHLPMILGSDRSKLSKRHGAVSTLQYRDQGYLSEALVNFLALLGWSLDDHTELFSRDDLVRHFTLERVTKAGAIFNAEKLTWMNGVYIRTLPADDLADRLTPYLERPEAEGGLPDDAPRPVDRADLLRAVPLVRERLKTLSEAAEALGFFFADPRSFEALLTLKGMAPDQTRDALEATRARCEALEAWEEVGLEGALRPLAEDLGLKTGQLFGAVRVAVTGRTAAPPLFETMHVLGRERCLARLRAAAETLRVG